MARKPGRLLVRPVADRDDAEKQGRFGEPEPAAARKRRERHEGRLPDRRFLGYEVLGIYQNKQIIEETASIDGATPGDLWYKDQNGDGVIDKDDRIYMGSYLPKVTRAEHALRLQGRRPRNGSLFEPREQNLQHLPSDARRLAVQRDDRLPALVGRRRIDQQDHARTARRPRTNNQYSQYYEKTAAISRSGT